ncbi:hypothetical protein SAMN02745194_04137 [Roseomonas rosea]|uniref:Cell division protein FtsL n=1 Tax=Muricoccus roseus TaxID=198092 RepID=A0A1M6PLI9_9PROT|nr:hypothetical protein [Roseomonas rosea]SHK08791.1 hypothetical protein SAMN02745194_04137 [Roseomonas rosea]
MIRPLTFLSLVAAAGAGLHLYSVKHEVSQLEKTLRETVRQTEAARERTAVLRAEWALLNEPERLRAAAVRNLPLEVMQTSQFVRPAELDRRLPAAVAFAGAPSLFAPAPNERPGASNVAIASAVPVSVTSPVAEQAANAAPRLAQAPATAAPAAASVSVVPLPAAPPRAAAPAQMAARPAPVERSAPERVERSTATAERGAPTRVPPSHLPQVAGLRTPEPREATPRVAPRLAAPVRPAEARQAEPRLADREVDRGMNLAAPPQPPALLRTALHLRQTTPAVQPPSPRMPEMPASTGSMLGGASRPMLAPPVPVASANAATLGGAR